ncbi:MAG: SDR family oxidoreductase [Gemmataceae bacterium]
MTPLRLPLLVTGITGVAGYNAFFYFRRLFPGRVIGLRPRQTFRLAGPGIVALDADDAAGLRDLCREFRFGSVLNAVGNCALKSCELDPVMARRLNVETAAAIVASAAEHDLRLVHLSSDLVFSGDSGKGNYHETDPTDPVTVYGQTMAAGERIILGERPNAAVLRISLPMGPSFSRHAGAIDWIDSRFRHGRPATLYFDEVRSATYTDDLNRVFEWFLHGDAAGLFHAGGPRAVTLNQIGQIVNRVGGYDPQLLRGCPRLEAGPIPPRAGNVSLNSDKLVRAMDGQPFRPWPADKRLVPTGRAWHFERAPGEAGSWHRIEETLYRYDERPLEYLPAGEPHG